MCAARARRPDGDYQCRGTLPSERDQRKLFEQLAKTLGSEVRPQERSFLDKLKEVLGG